MAVPVYEICKFRVTNCKYTIRVVVYLITNLLEGILENRSLSFIIFMTYR